ncbi:MAG: hypothetical protein ACLRMJ_02985 [Alistipes finegoldii]
MLTEFTYTDWSAGGGATNAGSGTYGDPYRLMFFKRRRLGNRCAGYGQRSSQCLLRQSVSAATTRTRAISRRPP